IAGLSLLLIFTAVSFSQTSPIRGTVKMLKEDGSKVPVVGALVEPYRIDIDSGKSPSSKTDKEGQFSFAGFPVSNKYILSVSAPGMAPFISGTVTPGTDAVDIVLRAGDGKVLTEAEVRASAKQAPKGGSIASEEDRKKADAEYQKQLAKYNEEKKKAEDSNKIVNESLQAGDAAFKAKNYDLAISKFDEGVNADPDFEGSAPVLLNYKGVALKQRGFEAYQRAAKDPAVKEAEMAKAKADLTASIEALDRGLKVIAAAKPADVANKAAGGADAATLEKSKYNLLSNSVESYRLIVRTKADIAKAKDAPPIFEQYFAAETDPAKKLAARLVLGDIMREAGESEQAIAAYRVVLESSPDNPDALAGIGLSLFNVGVSEENKPKMQEGLNYMQKFADTAPDTHPLKASVKDAVDYLKTEQKLAPQKTTAPKKKT
ncbi:MAG: tetratricopeptide repeat protein, partial [Pyrinomonadaceae bacterium]